MSETATSLLGDSATPRRFGAYELITSIGRGGMGEILVARSLARQGKLVALKALSEAASKKDSVVAMFMDEASIMSRVHHPNVLEIYDFGKEAERYFIVMEYLQGCSLARLIVRAHERGQILDPAIVAFIGAAAARGLHAAHTAVGRDGAHLRVVHRDVSPGNIFITYSGATKVIDFGIARADKRLSRTSAGIFKGKAAYMSPEQVREEPLGGRSDIFALGVCLWEAITGRRLFLKQDQFETMAAVVQAPIDPPTALIDRPDAVLDEIILEALERDVNRRPPTAAVFEASLSDYHRRARPNLSERDVAEMLRGFFSQEFEKEVALLRDLEQTSRSSTAEHRLRAIAPKSFGHEESPTFAGNSADLEAMERLSEPAPPAEHVARVVESMATNLAPLEARQAEERAALTAKIEAPKETPMTPAKILAIAAVIITLVAIWIGIAASR